MEFVREPLVRTDFEVVNALRDWWENDSRTWQDCVFYTLCAAYSLVAAFALVQLIRIQRRVPEYGWTTQKVFHFMNFVVNAARALVFGFYQDVYSFKIEISRVILLEFPGLIFFSTYTLLVLFWAEIYHQARSMPSEKLRPGFLYINGVIYFIQIIIWLAEWIKYNAVTQAIVKLFFAAVSCLAAFGFAIYGGRLFSMLRRFPLESKGRIKKLREIGFITAICFTCFIIRTVVVAFSAFNENVDLDVLNHPLLNFLYYMVVEILPSALVLFILRKIPPKRAPAQYHPIRTG
ncbi:hypothetical protein KP509_15G041600 [Ceratopteris richardii]|uniref:THH1/TOM1/TOM3 domain-containing protein n=1 Tax=Ceratopteris richardii TaxID=49495 RepID=A0A8T2T7J0_CERRI|nr:hypothetical protein KP509_15G041600 [Ceratopteris richardii]KAH7404768.1 hypothetical protein KP509_15G041600 [Ceratopteris richardii]